MNSPQHHQYHLCNNPYKVATASMISTAIEFYDYYIYAAMAVLVLNPQLFDKSDPAVATLLSLSTLALAFFACSVGSVLFGHFGDKTGREKTLVVSLLTMGLSTVCTGLLLTYQEISLLASPLLCICRIDQSIGLDGGWGGVALVATGNASEGKRAWFGTSSQLGALIGLLMTDGAFFLISSIIGYGALVEWGRRILFITSLALALIGLWMRMTMHESYVYREAEEQGKAKVASAKEVLAGRRKPILQGMFVMVSTYVLFYIMTAFAQVYFKSPAKLPEFGHSQGLSIPANMFMGFLMINAVVFGVFINFSGIYADKIGRCRFLIWVTFVMLVFGLLMPQFLTHGSPASVLVLLLIGMVLMGLILGPMAALLFELFLTEMRHSGTSLAYNFVAIIGASIATLVAIELNVYYGIIGVGVYLVANYVLILVALISTHEVKDVDLVDTQ